jgi:hypothetical protein
MNFDEVYQQCVDNDHDIVDFYRDKKGHLSHTSLSKFRTSPFEFLRYKTIERPATKALSDGKMMHMLLFEPEKFNENYYAVDDRKKCEEISGPNWKAEGKKPRSTKAYKEWIAGWAAKFPGKERVSIDQLVTLQTALKRAMTNKDFNRIVAKMSEGHTESTIIQEVDGYAVKAILDVQGANLRADLKFVSDNSDRAVERAYWGDAYWTWVQQGLYAYLDGQRSVTHMIYLNHDGDVNIKEVPQTELRRGFDEFRWWIKMFDHCINKRGTLNIDSSFWRSGANVLHLPSWIDPDGPQG